jgi:hypothetical protein
MPIEQFASRIGASTRTVAGWRENPGRVPQMDMQEALDVVLESAPDRVKALFAILAENDNEQPILLKELTPDESERVASVMDKPSRLGN